MISVIIPALDEEKSLPRTLADLKRQQGPFEIIVVDGGSTDRTREVAADEPDVRLIGARRGRALQLNAGAAVARGEILLFLHADTRLPPGAIRKLAGMGIRAGAVWGGFRHRFSGDDWRLRLISRLHNWRCSVSRVFYGDQAMFVQRDLFRHAGGFPEVDILEDIAISERLRAVRPPVLLDDFVVTDARKFIKMGVWRILARVLAIMLCNQLRLPIPTREFFSPVR